MKADLFRDKREEAPISRGLLMLNFICCDPYTGRLSDYFFFLAAFLAGAFLAAFLVACFIDSFSLTSKFCDPS